ncbi:MAG: leucine-rich repeat domain-containing protein, partial [Bacilli bacterium]|nr:leucine-rich repeat domain-containing protein [Bacilli bacterium]
MKKILKFIIIIFLGISLTSCKDTSHRELLDQLCDQNYEYSKGLLSSIIGVKYTLYSYELSEIEDDEFFSVVLSHDAFKNEGIDRVIFSKLEMNGQNYWGPNVIEFKTVKDAKKMMEKDDIVNISFIRYENIVYYMDFFGATLIHGVPVLDRGLMVSENKEVVFCLHEYNTFEVLPIPNNAKYIVNNAFQYELHIIKITCGINLEKIGLYAMQNMENLEYFKANANLKSLGNGALSNNPKLKTVILNEGLEYIGEKAFAECPNLEYVVIPSSVKDIGYRAFTHG